MGGPDVQVAQCHEWYERAVEKLLQGLRDSLDPRDRDHLVPKILMEMPHFPPTALATVQVLHACHYRRSSTSPTPSLPWCCFFLSLLHARARTHTHIRARSRNHTLTYCSSHISQSYCEDLDDGRAKTGFISLHVLLKYRPPTRPTALPALLRYTRSLHKPLRRRAIEVCRKFWRLGLMRDEIEAFAVESMGVLSGITDGTRHSSPPFYYSRRSAKTAGVSDYCHAVLLLLSHGRVR